MCLSIGNRSFGFFVSHCFYLLLCSADESDEDDVKLPKNFEKVLKKVSLACFLFTFGIVWFLIYVPWAVFSYNSH